MIPGSRFLASSHRISLLRAYIALLWLEGFLFASAFEAALYHPRDWWQWAGLIAIVAATAAIGYVLNQRLLWIDRALPPVAGLDVKSGQQAV